jgi:hypothetical protein
MGTPALGATSAPHPSSHTPPLPLLLPCVGGWRCEFHAEGVLCWQGARLRALTETLCGVVEVRTLRRCVAARRLRAAAACRACCTLRELPWRADISPPAALTRVGDTAAVCF